jgi:hypothetical protein
VSAYRIYVLDQAGQVSGPPHIVVCDDDEPATDYARQYYLDGKPVGVWVEARCVIRLDPQ